VPRWLSLIGGTRFALLSFFVVATAVYFVYINQSKIRREDVISVCINAMS